MNMVRFFFAFLSPWLLIGTVAAASTAANAEKSDRSYWVEQLTDGLNTS